MCSGVSIVWQYIYRQYIYPAVYKHIHPAVYIQAYSSVCMYTCVYTCVCIHVHIHVYVYRGLRHSATHIQLYIDICIQLYKYIHTQMRVCIQGYPSVGNICICSCTYIYTYIQLYIYIYTQTRECMQGYPSFGNTVAPHAASSSIHWLHQSSKPPPPRWVRADEHGQADSGPILKSLYATQSLSIELLES